MTAIERTYNERPWSETPTPAFDGDAKPRSDGHATSR